MFCICSEVTTVKKVLNCNRKAGFLGVIILQTTIKLMYLYWCKLYVVAVGRIFNHVVVLDCTHLYYIDRSVLLENTPRVKFIRNYIRDPSGVFSISSLVRILMTSFPALSQSFVQTVGDKWRAIDLSI